jgi:hypothetical protein
MNQTTDRRDNASVGGNDGRRTWHRPTIQRLSAHSAEGGPGAAGDACPNPGSDSDPKRCS